LIMKNLTIKVSTATHSALKEAAKEQKLSISELGRSYLDAAVKRRAWEHGVAPVLPDLRTEIENRLIKMEDRFARLLYRTAIEGGATKRLVLQVLTELQTASDEDIVRWEKEKWEASRQNLDRPLKALDELMESPRTSPARGESDG